jgi:transposase
VYAGIDLHSNNSVVVIQDDEDRVVKRRRVANQLETVLETLEPYRDALGGVVVESTYNWYWLVDGLQDHGYRVHLANTAAIEQYSGLKYADDESDARWLATMLRLGLLPEGHICPREERGVRDLVRKRSQLVRHHTAHPLSIENLILRNTGARMTANEVKVLTPEKIDALHLEEDLALAVKANVAVLSCLQEQIEQLEKVVLAKVRLRKAFKGLLTVSGIGRVLAATIMLETGDIQRFKSVGNYVSYCRCVRSVRLSNQKKKGKGNTKNGNKYLSWAFIEAAHFAIRWDAWIRRFYDRKAARTKRVVAIKAVSHKLARACYHVMNDGVAFDVHRAFGSEAQTVEPRP